MNSTVKVKKWAILIGIDFYVKEHARLKGCVQDMEDVQKFLNDRYQNTNITTFLARVTGDSEQKIPTEEKSSWPTFDNITTKFQDVTEQSSSGDFVYIHYSGHGTQRDTRPKEFRKYRYSNSNDSALVLFDESREIRYLRGFKLAGLLDRMVEKGLIVTVVLDCCHSGGVTRGDSRFRGLDWDDNKGSQDDENPGFLTNNPSAEPNKYNDGNYRNGYVDEHWLLKPRNYTLLAACGGLEKAKEEVSLETGKTHGVFTYNLLQLLKSAGSPKSHRLIHRELCVNFHVSWPAQHPVLLGNFDTILFENSGTREAYSAVVCDVLRKEGSKIVLNQGRVHGICVDDEYELCSQNELMQMEKVLVQVRVVRDFEVETECADECGQPNRSTDIVGIGWHAQPRTYYPKMARVGLGFDILKDQWQKAIEGSCWLQVAKDDLPDPNSYAIKINTQDEYEIQRNERTFNIFTISIQHQDAISKTVANLEHLVKYARVEELRSETEGQLPKEFHIRRKQSENETIRIADGENIRIILKNTGSRPLYVSIYNLTPLYKIQRLWLSDKYCSEIASKDDITIIPKMTIPERLLEKGKKEADDVLKFFVTTKRHNTLDSLILPECAANENDSLRSVESRRNRTDFHNAVKGLSARSRGTSLNAKDEEWYAENLVIQTFAS